MANYENILLDSMEMVVQNALNNAKYDRTIQGTILKCNDSLQGIYTVKYQDAKFTAYASNVNDIYTENTQVYILVPENNMSLHKTIIGTVKNLGTGYSSVILDSQRFFEVGSNIITLHREFGLCSYKCLENIPSEYKNVTLIFGTKINEETGNREYIYEDCHGIILYDSNLHMNYSISNRIDNNGNLIYIEVKDGNDTILTIDVAQLNLVFQKNTINTLKMGGVFRTTLPEEQQSIPGDYGIYVEVTGIYNKTQSQKRFLTIGTNSMIGNPYQLFVDTEQINYKDINNYIIESIDKIIFFGKDFPKKEDLSQVDAKPNDIFLSGIFCHPCYQISEQELTSFNLQVRTPQGIYFRTDESPSATRLLDAIVRKGATNVTNSDQISFYWFEENAKINFRTGYSSGYDQIGGDGWKCLNTLDTTSQSHISDVSTHKVKKKDLVFEEKRFLCAAIYNDLKMTKEVTMYNYDAQYKIVLSSSRGTSFNTTDIGTTQINVLVYERQNGIWQILNKDLYEADWYTQDEYGNYQNQAIGINYLTIDLNNFTTTYNIKCAVTLVNSNGSTGSATLELQKTSGISGKYSLIINNKNKLFLYDEQGISPTHKQNIEQSITILPINYYIYNNETGEKILGENLPKDFAKWEFPSSEKSLIIKEELEEYNSEVTFDIADKYDSTKADNNSIILTVTYDGETLTGITDIIFAKQGDNGTNGTRFALKIIPNKEIFKNSQYFPVVPLNSNSTIFSPNTQSNWFNVALYYDGVLIYEGSTSGSPNRNTDILTENSGINVKWEFVKSSNKDYCSFEVDSDTGLFWTKEVEYNFPNEHLVNIIQATVTYGKKSVVASMPIATVIGQGAENVYIVDNTGFRFVTYKADKTTPAYVQSSPFFEIKPETIVSWTTVGESYYNNDWHKNKQLSLTVDDNGNYILKPSKEYDGFALSNAVVGYNDNIIIHIPIHFMLNRYANAAINDWDGNKIVLDDEDGAILAPQVIAGIKESDNSFTGAFMGTARHMSEDDDVGFMTYNHGQRSFFLDAYTGAATFGIEEVGAIKVEPGKEPVIQSGNYREKDKKTEELGQGISIGFGAEPYITFGTKKFYVEPDGTMYAEGATINGEFEVYNEDSVNQSHIFLKENKSEIRLFDYAEAEFGTYVRGETYITPKQFLIAGYNPKDYKEPLAEKYNDYNLPEPYNYFKYKNGQLELKGEFECQTDSSDIAFKNSASATHIKFWNNKIENKETEKEVNYIKNISEWTPAHLYLYNYGNGEDGYERYNFEDFEQESPPPKPKGYFKYNSSGLAIKGTFSAETKSSKVRFSDKPMQNYIKFADVVDTEDGMVVKGEGEWTPRHFSLKTYGTTGKKKNTAFSEKDEILTQLYEKFLNGEITEEQYDTAEASYMSQKEVDEDSDDIVSSLTYMNGILRYKGGLTLSAPPYAKLTIDPNDGKNSVLQFKDFIELENEEVGDEISSTTIKPGELTIKTREVNDEGIVSDDASELIMRKGRLRLKGELDFDTPVVKIRFAKGGPENSYISFNNQVEMQNSDTGESYSQLVGKQRMSAEMFRLATYDEEGNIDSSFKFKDGKMKYRGDMEIKTNSGIFTMTQDKMLIRMGETDEEGRKITDFRLTPKGFSFRSFGPKEEEDVSGLPTINTKTITYYKQGDPGTEIAEESFMNGTYNNINIYMADYIPEDNVTDEVAQKIDEMFTIKTSTEENLENLEDLNKYDVENHVYINDVEQDKYSEYSFVTREDGEEQKVENVITENYKDVVPAFMDSTNDSSWTEKSALVYDSEYGKLRLNGNLSVRNDHGTVILDDNMMRITFKSFAQEDGVKKPRTRMSISEDSFYFYTFGRVYEDVWEYAWDGATGKYTYQMTGQRDTNRYGIISGIYYTPDVGLRLIGTIDASYGKIGGWDLSPGGMKNGSNIIDINAANGRVTATGEGMLESRWNQRRSSLMKGRIMIEGVGHNVDIRNFLKGILEELNNKQREIVPLIEAAISEEKQKTLKLNTSVLDVNNYYATVQSKKFIFNFPSTPEDFFASLINSDIAEDGEKYLKYDSVNEWYETKYNVWRNQKILDYKDLLEANIGEDGLDVYGDKEEAWNNGIDGNYIRTGWANFGSIYGGENQYEGVNIVAEGLQSGEYGILDDFENQKITKISEDLDWITKELPRGIYFGLLTNMEQYDATELNAERKARENSSKEQSDSDSAASSVNAIFWPGHVAAFNAYKWTDRTRALGKNAKPEEDTSSGTDGELLQNPFYYYTKANQEGKFGTHKTLGRLGMIIGYEKETSTTEEGNNQITSDTKRYVYGTELFPHMVKTDDIFVHNKNLQGYQSTSLEGILNELHKMPTRISWDETNKNAPKIIEEWEIDKMYYNEKYEKLKQNKTFIRTWELELDEQQGDNIDLNDREVKALILKAADEASGGWPQKDIRIELSGFIVDL